MSEFENGSLLSKKNDLKKEQTPYSESQNFDDIERVCNIRQNKGNSEFIKDFENKSIDNNNDNTDDVTKKNNISLISKKSNKFDNINHIDIKINIPDYIYKSVFEQNDSEEEDDSLGLVNNSISQNSFLEKKRYSSNNAKNINDKTNENPCDSKQMFKFEYNLTEISENLEKKSKINEGGDINEDNATNKNINDNTSKLAHKNQKYSKIILKDSNISPKKKIYNFLGNSSKPEPSSTLENRIKLKNDNFSPKGDHPLKKEIDSNKSNQTINIKNDKNCCNPSKCGKSLLDNIENKDKKKPEDIIANGINYEQELNKSLLDKKKNPSIERNNYNDNKIFDIKKIMYVFNIQVYKKNYKKNNSEKYPFKIDKIEPPSLLVFDEIKKRFTGFSNLWGGKNTIFTNEEDFNDIVNKGDITRNILNILENKKEKIELKRAMQPDEMCQKYKALLVQESINSINSYNEFIDNKIEIIDKYKIYEAKKADFNLILLDQKIYSIISNDINGINPKSNFLKIKKIMDEYDENEEHPSLFKHLNLSLQDVLDIILYNNANNKFDAEINIKFKTKIIEFLNKIYKKLKYKDESDKKDYIAALLLLGYNLKRYFMMIRPRKFRIKK